MAALLSVGAAHGVAAGVYTDTVAAIVRDQAITVFELYEETQHAEEALRKLHKGEALQNKVVEVRRAAARKMIEKELVYAEFEEVGGVIPSDLVQKRLDRIVVSQTGGDRRLFEARLVEQGTTLDDFEEKVTKGLAVELMLNEMVFRHVHVAPSDVVQYYNSHQNEFGTQPRIRLQAIVLTEKKAGCPEKLEEAVKRVRQRLAAKEDFAQLATELSEDASASRGGDLGWVEAGSANPKFLEAVKGLEAGETAPPLRLGGNVYILRLKDRAQGGVAPLDEALRREIERKLRFEEEQRRYQEYVGQLRQKYYVKEFF